MALFPHRSASVAYGKRSESVSPLLLAHFILHDYFADTVHSAQDSPRLFNNALSYQSFPVDGCWEWKVGL